MLRDDGVLEVRVADQHWRKEVKRSAPLVLERLAAMLGEGTVMRLEIIQAPTAAKRR
jgi:hypothetical protein